MQITINNKDTEIFEGETVLEAANRTGFNIPSMCYAKGFKHRSSCMVCVVKNLTNGQIIPACTTYPEVSMKIETDSEEVHNIRKLSLELLLSDHRADCEAPCSLVCPKGLDVEQMLNYYDTGRYETAYLLISKAFALPEVACDTCKAPCEKACRRGTIDNAVTIREIIRQVVSCQRYYDVIASLRSNPEASNQAWIASCLAMTMRQNRIDITVAGMSEQVTNESVPTQVNKNMYQSRLGRFTSKEKERIKTGISTPSRCLHCACAGRTNCKLRIYATSEGIKKSRYEASSVMPAMNKQHVKGDVWFEQAKCIRCGLCVYNSVNGFTFKDRGFGLQVVLPDENRENINEDLVTLCPTGALWYEK